MPLASNIPTAADAGAVESDARRLAVRLEKGRYLVLAVLTLLYIVGAILHARGKPLWYDEIITVIASTQPDLSSTWKAASGTDANPPLPHLLTHLSMRWFGPSDVSARLPAIAGFWIFCLCLFFFTRRLGIFCSLLALLLPIATDAYTYAFEARAYGLELAFCGLLLLSWQAATRGSRRWLACAGIALSLIGALFCQYYAVLLYLPLAGAEAFRSLRARRIEWPIWLAFAIGGAPVVWRATLIRSVVGQFSQGSWSPAYPEQAVEFWETGLQHTLSFVVVGLAFMAIWMIRRRPAAPPDSSGPMLEPHELVAGVLFLAIPVAAIGAGMAITHLFTTRYALPGLAGAILLAVAMAARLTGGRALAGFLLLWLALLPLAFVSFELPPPRNPFQQEPILADALRRQPVAISDGQLFLQMWYYAPADLRPNLLFLSDTAAAVKYMGFDSLELGLRVLRPWSSVRTVDYRDFASPGIELLVYQNSLRPGWLIPRVLDDGGTVAVQSFTNYRQLYRVTLKRTGE